MSLLTLSFIHNRISYDKIVLLISRFKERSVLSPLSSEDVVTVAISGAMGFTNTSCSF